MNRQFKQIMKKEFKFNKYLHINLPLIIGNKKENLEKIATILGVKFNPDDFEIETIIENYETKNNDKEGNNDKKLNKIKKEKQKSKNKEEKKNNKKLKKKSTNKKYAKLYENKKCKKSNNNKIDEEENDENLSQSEDESLIEEKEIINDELSQNSLESEIEEQSQTSKSEEESFSGEEECSNTTKSENELLIQNNFIEKQEEEKNIQNQNSDNKINILKKEEGECSSSNNFDQNYLIIKQRENSEFNYNNYWKPKINNGRITEQKYFNYNDWMLYEALTNNNKNKSINNVQITTNKDLNGYYSINELIDELINILHKWNKNGLMLISGSYLLNVMTSESDIDCILTIPSQYEDFRDVKIINKEQFFGNSDCNIEKRICDDNSFYCLLCQDYRTNSLRKIPGRVSTINLEFLGQQFDIILVVLPPKIILELNKVINNNIFGFEKNLSVKIFDKIIANFIESVGGYLTFNEKSEYLGMLLALSDNFIYGNRFGFFSGTSIAVLACHFILSNPDTSIITLLGKIFEYFSNKPIISYDGNIK
uniref:NTP_transf_2 domain-containing protein n=1 Tax=Meloidogyne hapla TaxID=6305 RepID=A0A1I8BGK8_MELHA